MKIVRTSKPQGQPYPLGFVKNYLRVDGTSDDNVIGTLISAAAGVIYTETWIDLQTASYTAYLDDYADIEIKRYPITEITSVKYYDVNGSLQTMSSGTDYEVDLNGDFAKVRFINTPALRDKEYNNIEIAFKSGYLTHYDIPEELTNAMLMLVKDWYDDQRQVGKTKVDMPLAVKTTLNNMSKRVIG